MPAPIARVKPIRASAVGLEFRASRDLKTFADGLFARRDSLSNDEKFYLAKALEECQFTTTLNEDLAGYSAKQRRQFLAGLPIGDPNNEKRIAAYDSVDSSQRCLRFQGSKIATKDIDDLYRSAAMAGDARSQARMLVADLNKNVTASRVEPSATVSLQQDDYARIVNLLESRDPDAIITVGQFLAQSVIANQLRIGPAQEYPEPSAFLGAFSLVACDLETQCVSLNTELQLACAHGGYCDAQTFETLYQNFLASPWTYMMAVRYRSIIHDAINNQDWSLLGLQPSMTFTPPTNKSSYVQKSAAMSSSIFAGQN